eukprot:403344384
MYSSQVQNHILNGGKGKSFFLGSLTILLTFTLTQSQVTIDPNIVSCSSSFFYDTTQYKCVACPENSIQDSTGRSCVCKDGFIIDFPTRFDFKKTCIKCPGTTAPSQDKKRCMNCQDPSFFNPLTQQCVCPANYITIDRDANGTDLANITCKLCDTNTYRGPPTTSVWSCQSCPHFAQVYNNNTTPWSCQCPSPSWAAAANICVNTTDVQNLTSGFPLEFARQVTYNYVLDFNENRVTKILGYSDLFSYYYYYSAIGCWMDEDPQKCQILANLCVLQLYNEQSTVCQLFQYLTTLKTQANPFYDDAGWGEGLPWLYYAQKPSDVVKKSGEVDITVSFTQQGGRNQSLTFYLARYHINGTFLGFQQLKSQLSICPLNYDDVLNIFKFGAVSQNECQFSLNELILDPINQPSEANVFFDLFIQDSKGNLIDVPVLIRNLVDRTDKQPNSANGFTDSWRFTRRFFLFDTISGIDQVGGYPEVTPSIVRWAADIKMKITLDPNNEERIYRPYLEITYKEKQSNLIHSNTVTHVRFVMDYFQDMTKFWRDIMIAFIVFHVLIVGIIAFRLYAFIKQNPPSLLPGKFMKILIWKMIYLIADVWSEIMFWILFFTSAYWFVTYKIQANAYILLPSVDDWESSYRIFDIVFGFILAMRLIAVVMKIIEQSTVDIFLIDWEVVDPYNKRDDVVDNVIVWRSIFLANEFNEMQIEYRYIKPETTLIWFAFFIKALGWEYFAEANPDMNATDNQLIPINYVLKFFLAALIFLCIMAVQYILEAGNSWVSSLKFQEFMDLCSVTNISMIIMDEPFHGYYIHGQAPWGRSDLTLTELKQNLDAEQSGLQQQRGLDNGLKTSVVQGQSITSFEIYLPSKIREEYDKIYKSRISIPKLQDMAKNAQKKKEVEESKDESGFQNKSKEHDESAELVKKKQKIKSSIDINLQSERERMIFEHECKKQQLSNQLKKVINEVYINKAQYIMERGCWERLLKRLPVEINLGALTGIPYLVRDMFSKWPNFTSILYCSLDYQIVILFIMFFSVFDRASGSSIISIGIIYIIEKLLKTFRQWLGESNLSKKTLIDSRFFV